MAVSPRPFDVSLYVNPPFYLKQIRYNGAPLPGIRVPLSLGSPAQQLELVMDNRVGSITGSAAHTSQPSVLILWSEEANRPSPVAIENGFFTKDNLIPGEYRAVVVLRSESATINLLEAAKAGKRVTIRAGEVTTLDLR